MNEEQSKALFLSAGLRLGVTTLNMKNIKSSADRRDEMKRTEELKTRRRGTDELAEVFLFCFFDWGVSL